ncbi:hypothetical protein NFI96_025207 [Prochilodus magdalenae]|nr:hypothetical protein NFI96_025207 [Prochilodus magdalenae]
MTEQGQRMLRVIGHRGHQLSTESITTDLQTSCVLQISSGTVCRASWNGFPWRAAASQPHITKRSAERGTQWCKAPPPDSRAVEACSLEGPIMPLAVRWTSLGLVAPGERVSHVPGHHHIQGSEVGEEHGLHRQESTAEGAFCLRRLENSNPPHSLAIQLCTALIKPIFTSAVNIRRGSSTSREPAEHTTGRAERITGWDVHSSRLGLGTFEQEAKAQGCKHYTIKGGLRCWNGTAAPFKVDWENVCDLKLGPAETRKMDPERRGRPWGKLVRVGASPQTELTLLLTNRECTIGRRKGCDLSFPANKLVSGDHCKITQDQTSGQVWLEDMSVGRIHRGNTDDMGGGPSVRSNWVSTVCDSTTSYLLKRERYGDKTDKMEESLTLHHLLSTCCKKDECVQVGEFALLPHLPPVPVERTSMSRTIPLRYTQLLVDGFPGSV